jgi:uncharacterized protein involved in exopolysaccharide biosynthesis
MSVPAPALDPLPLLRVGWARIVIVAALATVGAAAYSLVAPKWYQSQLVVVPVPAPRGGVPLLGGSGGLQSMLELPVELNLGPSDVERVAAVFHSASVTNAVIEKFDLTRRYRLDYVEDARTELWRHCSTHVEKKPGLVVLTCEDRSPDGANAMAEFFGEVGNRVFRRVSASSAGEERRFLEARVAQARHDMDEASRRLKEFQERNRIVDIGEQAKAVVSSMATLRAEMLAKQVQLAYLDGVAARDEASTEQLRKQIAVIEDKLRSLEVSQTTSAPVVAAVGAAPRPRARGGRRGAPDSQPGLFPGAMRVPMLRYELEQLFREQKVQETLYLLLSQRHEMARVSEARDTSTFQILDRPTRATRRWRPRRTLITGMGFFFGLVLGVGVVLAPAYWRRRTVG